MILAKTELGRRVLKDRSVRLTPGQRTAFILFDGKRSLSEVLSGCVGVNREGIEQMIELGLLAPSHPNGAPALATPAHAQPAAAATGSAAQGLIVRHASAEPAAPAAPGRSPQECYKDAYRVATQLLSGLGLRGTRLILAVEGAGGYEELLALAPRIRAAVGPEKARLLERALVR